MSNVYLQIPLNEKSQECTVINTRHKGLFKYKRLAFGISTAPSIFQRVMDICMQGLPGVQCFIDNNIVAGRTEEECLQNLDISFQRLKDADFQLHELKCSFLKPRIDYLGHSIDAVGRHPLEEKIRAIKEAPAPKNVTELRSFLGILNYYSKFLPNLSSKLTPLYSLLEKDKKWSWGLEQDVAFQLAKNSLHADSVLLHFDPNKPLVLSCDASQYGLGAVISHTMDDGSERPIAYASRTLNSAERNYSQLEREALAIIYGVKKFNAYLYGRKFTIYSDHKPLSFIFNAEKRIPDVASPRVQRWALTLAGYRYDIRYKAGTSLGNADALSRLPLPKTVACNGTTAETEDLIDHIETISVDASQIADWTARDSILSQVKRQQCSFSPLVNSENTLTPL